MRRSLPSACGERTPLEGAGWRRTERVEKPFCPSQETDMGNVGGKWPTKATFSARGSFPIKSKTLSPSLVMGIEGDQIENLDKQGG